MSTTAEHSLSYRERAGVRVFSRDRAVRLMDEPSPNPLPEGEGFVAQALL